MGVSLADCAPSIDVDGMRTRVDPDDFPPAHVEIVEVYRGISQLPREMADDRARRPGAIGVWTRRGH